MPTPLRILSASDVYRALPMPAAIDAMRRAFGQLSSGAATVPLRTRLQTDTGTLLVMPAYLHESRALSVKLVSVYPENPEQGLPVVTATVLVFEAGTGLPRALIDGTSLTALRTGAGGGLAAGLLARTDVGTVALFGAGVQARTQLQAALAVRPIRHVFILSRTRASAERLAGEIATWPNPPRVTLPETPREAVQQAGLVLAATTSSTPVFDGRDLQPGTHVTGVGSYTPDMREVDAVTVERARIFVDERGACAAEAGDLIRAGSTPEQWTELGELVNRTRPGRRAEDEITFFKSVGVAAQDAAAAAAVLESAEAMNLGTVVHLA